MILSRVHLVGLKFNERCNEVKFLKAIAISEGLLNIFSLNVRPIIVELDCLGGC